MLGFTVRPFTPTYKLQTRSRMVFQQSPDLGGDLRGDLGGGKDNILVAEVTLLSPNNHPYLVPHAAIFPGLAVFEDYALLNEL